MEGNLIASIFAVLHIFWAVPIGYFTVLSIINNGQVKAS